MQLFYTLFFFPIVNHLFMYYYYNHIFLTSRKVFFCFSIAYNITNCLIMSMTVGTVIVWVLFLLYLVCSFFFPGAGLTQGFIWVFQYTRREGFEPQLCIWLDGFQQFPTFPIFTDVQSFRVPCGKIRVKLLSSSESRCRGLTFWRERWVTSD